MSQIDYRHESTVDEEQELREIEQILFELASEGELDFPIPEHVEKAVTSLPVDFSDRLWKKIRTQDQIHQRLKVARKSIPEENYSFTQLLKIIRQKAGISLEDIALALRLQPSEVESIENGQVDPWKLSAENMVKVIEVFSIPMRVLERSLPQQFTKSFSILSTTRNREGTTPEPKLPSSYCERIRHLLKQYGREDLL